MELLDNIHAYLGVEDDYGAGGGGREFHLVETSPLSVSHSHMNYAMHNLILKYFPFNFQNRGGGLYPI